MRAIAVTFLLVAEACAPPSHSSSPRLDATAASAKGPSVWSVDVVTVRSGERERYYRFLDANWARARRTAQARGEIRSFRALFAADSVAPGAATQVILMTEYPDSAAYTRREEIFGPILAAQGRTLIDGKATRELTERVESRWFLQALGDR